MNATQLLEHFDRLAEAPGAVSRLRRFVLDLAVRGKLVEQDAGDEPAVELMKQIRSGKAKRIKSGEVRNPRDLTFPESEAPPFLLPPLWNWVRLADVGAIVGGGTPPAGDADNFTEGGKGIGWLTPADLGKHKGLFVSHGVRDLTAAGLKAGSATLMPKGSVLFTSRAPIGYVAIAVNQISTNQGFKSVVPYLDECSRYIATYLQAFGPQIDSQATGTTFKEVSGKIVSGLPLPLPPLAEQHRIVAKVDELMALCDQLEDAQQERERRRDRLAAASLQRLNQPAVDATPEAQREHARFHLNHLPRFTTRPEHIKAMQQTIRSLAVRGLLKTESANDESAAVLTNRIEMAKSRAATHENLKKDKGLWDGLAKEPPFNIPQNWKWVRLQDIFEISRGGSPRPAGDPMYFGGTIPWITVGEITKDLGKELIGTAKGLTQLGAEKSRFIYPGDLLLTNSGATLGVPKISHIKGCINDGVAVLRRFHTEDINDFSYLYLQSQTDEFRRVNQGIGQPNLNTPIIAGWYIPLPPLAEQHRIVAKVDALMALCHQLEAQLTIVQTYSRRLLEKALDGELGIVRGPMDSEAGLSPSFTLDSDLQLGKASRFMTTNPALTVDQLLECIDDLGGSALPDRLLKRTGLGEDVEAFYDLLRAARDSGKVKAPLGGGKVVRRHSNAD